VGTTAVAVVEVAGSKATGMTSMAVAGKVAVVVWMEVLKVSTMVQDESHQTCPMKRMDHAVALMAGKLEVEKTAEAAAVVLVPAEAGVAEEMRIEMGW